MEKLLQHVTLSIVLSALVSVAIQTVKGRLQRANLELNGKTWFILSILISVIVALAYTLYYQDLGTMDAFMVWMIMVFGAQGFYDVLLDKDTENKETDIDA